MAGRKNSVLDIDLGLGRIRKDLRRLAGSYVKVGIQAGSRERSRDGKITDLVTVAIANEYGVPADSADKRQPARSFMRSTFEEKKESLAAAMQVVKDGVLTGTMTAETGLNQVGLLHTRQIQEKIDSGVPPENAPSTIARKGSSETLRDTGHMKQSIRHVVKIGGKP